MEDEVKRAAEGVARRYARRVFWADEDDLRQEAYVIAIDARRRWDPTVGVPLSAYAWRACALGLRNYLWRQSAPVTETDHRLTTLRGVHRAEVNEDCWRAPSPDELLVAKRWHEDVQEQIAFVLKHGNVDTRLVLPVLIEERAPRHVAKELEVPVIRIYRSVRRARVLLSENALLHMLWDAPPTITEEGPTP